MKLPPRIRDTDDFWPGPGGAELAGRPASDEVIIVSDIPDRHPHKTAIEDKLHAAMTGLQGPWRVEVLCVGSGRWWLICVERPSDGFRSTVLFPPWEQEPEHIMKGMGEVLARA